MLTQQGDRVVIEPDLALAGLRLGPSLDDVRTDQKQRPGRCEISGLQVGAAPPESAGVTLSELTRASLASAPILRPASPRQVPDTVVVAIWLITVTAILALGVAAAIRWPGAAAGLAFRAGYAAGVAWARLRSFGTWRVARPTRPPVCAVGAVGIRRGLEDLARFVAGLHAGDPQAASPVA